MLVHYLLSVCITSCATASCSHLAPVDSAPALLAVVVVVVAVVAHPLMSKLLICALPRLSAVCCPGCLSRLVPIRRVCLPSSNDCDINIGLHLPCPTMYHQPPLHLIPSPLTIMTGCCGDDFPAVLRSSFLHFLLAWLVAPCLAHVLYHLVTALPCAVCG